MTRPIEEELADLRARVEALEAERRLDARRRAAMWGILAEAVPYSWELPDLERVELQARGLI